MSVPVASSTSPFRCVERETQNPSPGDVVVFKHKDDDLARAGRGHVGLFVSRAENSITVLGGNQKKRKSTRGLCSGNR